MKRLSFSSPEVASTAERRAVTLLGITLGLLVGCGVLGPSGIGFVVYFAAWSGEVLAFVGEGARKGGMLFGYFLGFALWLTLWAAIGGLVFRLLARIGKKRGEQRAV